MVCFWFLVLGLVFLVFGSSVFFGGFNDTSLVAIGFSWFLVSFYCRFWVGLFSSWFILWFSTGFWFLLSGFSWFLFSLVFILFHNSGNLVGFLVLLSLSGTPFLWFGFLVWVGLLGVVSWLIFGSGFWLLLVGLGGLFFLEIWPK